MGEAKAQSPGGTIGGWSCGLPARATAEASRTTERPSDPGFQLASISGRTQRDLTCGLLCYSGDRVDIGRKGIAGAYREVTGTLSY
jgi:hypothetical protein